MKRTRYYKPSWADCSKPPGAPAPTSAAPQPIAIDDAAHRSMTLGQLKAVLGHAQRRCEAEGWLGKRFPGGEMRYERLAPREINLYDVRASSPLTRHIHRRPHRLPTPVAPLLLLVATTPSLLPSSRRWRRT